VLTLSANIDQYTSAVSVGVPVASALRLIKSPAAIDVDNPVTVAWVLVPETVTVQVLGDPFTITVNTRVFPVPGAVAKRTTISSNVIAAAHGT